MDKWDIEEEIKKKIRYHERQLEFFKSLIENIDDEKVRIIAVTEIETESDCIEIEQKRLPI